MRMVGKAGDATGHKLIEHQERIECTEGSAADAATHTRANALCLLQSLDLPLTCRDESV